MVDLAGTGRVEIRVEFDARFADPLERRIKLRLTNQKRVMLWAERLNGRLLAETHNPT
jgi:hypothetical protein